MVASSYKPRASLDAAKQNQFQPAAAPQAPCESGFHAKPVALVLLTLFLALAGLALPNTAAADGPLDSLRAAQQGIDQCDPDLFRQAVDVDAVFNNGFTALVSVLDEEIRAGNIGGAHPLLAMAVSGLCTGDNMNIALLKQLHSSHV